MMLKAGILKWDNNRKLPLKSGGTTDIYVNLRMMRNTPWMIRYLGDLYANALRRLHVQRFLEVPEAVSPLAGHISAITDLPLVTVRESVKTGRVVSGTLIGDLNFGERVALIDDVATNAESKKAALAEIRRVGAELAAIVALVDRQGGWQKHLAEAGYPNAPFWFGMTLHDIRRYLIEHGMMQRCDPEVEAKNPIIVALDGKSWDDLIPLLVQLRTSGCILKVNDLLLGKGAEWLLPNLSVYGRVMADFKGHDIPPTLDNMIRQIRVCPPWAITAHASGGPAMIEAICTALAGTPTILLAVTLLTSVDAETCEEIYTRQPLDQVKVLAALAYRAGARGFVCSTEEASFLRTKYPDAIIVVPGLNSNKPAGDQKRTGTFFEAKAAGANFFVGGRQFLGNPDPAAEISRVIKDELGVKIWAG